jgi:dTDP-4-dehydrorhamnose 3,5-epimerase
MKIQETQLEGVLLISPDRHGDHRGYFSETYSYKNYNTYGIDIDFVQDNHSMSYEICTLRGLHFQATPHAQVKLVRCGQGCLFDVAVDLRYGSPTYGQWIGVELSAKNGLQLLIPVGFAHGFITREANTEIIYKCSDYYSPECEGILRFDCPKININWGLNGLKPILSNKDANAMRLNDFKSPFVYER